MIHTVTYTA